MVKPTKIRRGVKERKGVLGGSSIGGALGFSTYKTPYDVYLEYTGQEPERVLTPEQEEAMEMGTHLEDFIAKRAEAKFNIKLKKTPYAYVSPNDSRIICHPDRLMIGDNIAVEIKSSSAFDSKRWGAPDSDEIPYDYLVQCLDYIECAVCEEVWLIRFSNNRLTRYIIKDNPELRERVFSAASEWLDKVDSGYVPPIEDYKTAISVFSEDTEGELIADEALASLVDEWRTVSEERKTLEQKEDSIKAMIVSSMAGKSRLVSADGEKLATYKKYTTKRFDAKSFEKDEPELYRAYLKENSYMKLS